MPERNRTTDAVRKAKERKRRNRIIHQEMLRFEAERLGITVQEVISRETREVNRVIAEHRAAPAQPARRPYAWDRW